MCWADVIRARKPPASFGWRSSTVDPGENIATYLASLSASEVTECAVSFVTSRANRPVAFATAKLKPLKLRSGGTPGIGRG